jgi:hypothetical protein
MTQINRQLSLWQGPNDVQLRLTDPYGHINSVVNLSLAECRQLGQALVALHPIEVIDVEAVAVEEPQPEPVVAQEEPAVEPEPEVEAKAVDTDWASMTRAEILAAVKIRYDVVLDDTLKKDALIAKAVQLEAEHDA